MIILLPPNSFSKRVLLDVLICPLANGYRPQRMFILNVLFCVKKKLFFNVKLSFTKYTTWPSSHQKPKHC